MYNAASRPTVINCIFYGNTVISGEGGGIYTFTGSIATLTNCIFWANSDDSGGTDVSAQISGVNPNVNYSCIQGWTNAFGGTGNFHADPCFVNPATRNYRLTADSPCLDAGTNTPSGGLPDADKDGKPRIWDGNNNAIAIVDLGAYELAPWIDVPEEIEIPFIMGSPDPVECTLSIRNIGIEPLAWTIQEDCSWLEVDPCSGSFSGEIYDVTLTADPCNLPIGWYPCLLKVYYSGTGVSETVNVTLHVYIEGEVYVPAEYSTIQQAIDAADEGKKIVVSPGIYPENIYLTGKDLHLASIDPTDPYVVANTVINGKSLGPVITFTGSEDPCYVLTGFTITGGYSYAGGGISSFNNNLTIRHCLISNNQATSWGAGLYHQGGKLKMKGCTVNNNIANFGAGLLCRLTSAELTNCTICDNSASFEAGGVHINQSTYQLNNCILWNNSDMSGTGEAAQLTIYGSSGEVGHNCIQGWTGSLGGIGNIGADPCFVDPCNGDYHLRSQGWRWNNDSGSWQQDALTSRCIDAGNPGFALNNEPLTVPNDPCNLQGINLRINMGAYGGTPEASIPPHDWPMLADINNDGTADLKDCTIQLADWLTAVPQKPGDLNRNETINIHDFRLLTQDWLKQTSWCEYE